MLVAETSVRLSRPGNEDLATASSLTPAFSVSFTVSPIMAAVTGLAGSFRLIMR
jgi:hypothetical protein